MLFCDVYAARDIGKPVRGKNECDCWTTFVQDVRVEANSLNFKTCSSSQVFSH